MPLPPKIPGRTSSKKKGARILANRYKVEKRLGSGNFGTAWIVSDTKAKEEKEKLKVLKEIPIGDLQPDETVDAMHEASLLRNLDHPGIVKFNDSFIEGQFFCIVTEFCEGGDLDQKIEEYKKKKKAIPEAQVVEWIIQLLLAIQYMHDRKVLHRDLKARNIFLRNNVIKIGDFGISRILMGTTEMASTFVGTPYYMSPEVLKHEGYNSKSDVWSIGCILYELCAQKHAFEGQSLMGVMYKIVEGGLPEWPKGYSKELKSVFHLMCEKEPHTRPGASEVIKHAFIAKQIEDLKNTMMDKHHQKADKDIVNMEYKQLSQDLHNKKSLEEIRRESEDLKWKNMTPRERMRLRKLERADEEARRMQAAALQQLVDNKIKYTSIRNDMNPYDTHYAYGARDAKAEIDRPKPGYDKFTIGGYKLQERQGESDGESTEEEDEDDDIVYGKPATSGADNFADDQEVTMKPTKSQLTPGHRPYATVGSYSSDDRPITPMKDRTVYDLRNSSLDFKDGVPENPDMANTYYSQFEDEFESDDSGTEGDMEHTVVGKGAGEEEVEDLINVMQNALDKSDTIKEQTLTDSSAGGGAFGPVVRDIKIRNLRADAEKKLGKEQFDAAYEYLKKSRFGTIKGSKSVDENQIMKGLSQIVKNPNDCFIVDQLLFLEYQAELAEA